MEYMFYTRSNIRDVASLPLRLLLLQEGGVSQTHRRQNVVCSRKLHTQTGEITTVQQVASKFKHPPITISTSRSQGMNTEAVVILERAVACGDREGIATRDLARLYR